jgi:hypothetical protein
VLSVITLSKPRIHVWKRDLRVFNHALLLWLYKTRHGHFNSVSASFYGERCLRQQQWTGYSDPDCGKTGASSEEFASPSCHPRCGRLAMAAAIPACHHLRHKLRIGLASRHHQPTRISLSDPTIGYIVPSRSSALTRRNSTPATGDEAGEPIDEEPLAVQPARRCDVFGRLAVYDYDVIYTVCPSPACQFAITNYTSAITDFEVRSMLIIHRRAARAGGLDLWRIISLSQRC